jgi:hypothetical protein
VNKWLFLLFLGPIAHAVPKVIACDDSRSQVIRVPIGRVATLNFPTAPREAIPGEGGFDIKRIQQDLVLKVLRPGASTNLVVYLEGRRCFFMLLASQAGDESIFVRDPKDKTIEVMFVDK